MSVQETLVVPNRKEDVKEGRVPDQPTAFAEAARSAPSWEELQREANSAFDRFSSSLAAGVPETLTIEQREDVGTLLSAWNYAYERDNQQWVPNGAASPGETDYWDSELWNQSDAMNIVLNPDAREMYMTYAPEEGVGTSMKGLAYLEDLLLDPEFEERGALLSYLTHRVWMDQARVVRTKNSINAPNIEARVQAAEQDLSSSKGDIHPVLIRATREFAADADAVAIETVFEHFRATHEKATAESVLLDQDLSYAEREALMTSYIRTFGFVDAIDTISRQLASAESNYKDDLEQLYGDFQGDNVREIMTTLSEVYENVDFQQYSLNSEALTAFEVDLLDNEVFERYMAKTGISREQLVHLDLAAGTGRHTKEILERGLVGHVIDLEIEEKHVRLIKQEIPEAEAVQGDWYDMPFGRGEYADVKIDVFNILGRSLHHGRKAHEVLQVLDGLRGVTSDEGTGTFDLGAIEGDYAENLAKFRANLKAKNIKMDDIRAKLIFDGPDNDHRFNRLLLDDLQVEAFLGLTGFKLVDRIEHVVDEARGIKNVYYVVEKDPNFDPKQISREALVKALDETDILLDPGTDYNLYVEAWGMTIGQALVGGLGNEKYRELNKAGKDPEVLVDVVRDQQGQRGLRIIT